MKMRLTAALLVCAMLLALLPAAAFAAAGSVIAPPADGDTVVIYNPGAGFAIGQAEGTSFQGVAGTVDGDTLTVGSGALIFTVHTDGTYYSFENQGKYLATDSSEALFLTETASEYTDWTMSQRTYGWLISNRAATYGSKPVSIEFYSGSFKGWTTGTGSVSSAFQMKFYRVTDALHGGVVNEPTVTIAARDYAPGGAYSFTATAEDYGAITSYTAYCTPPGGARTALTEAEIRGSVATFRVPASLLEHAASALLEVELANSFGQTYGAQTTVFADPTPKIEDVQPVYSAVQDTAADAVISAAVCNLGADPQIAMTLDGVPVTPTLADGRLTYAPGSLAAGEHDVRLTVANGNHSATQSWSFFVGDRQPQLYFGQMHCHTAEYSDGSGTLEEAYAHAMQATDLDFLFVTDHSNYFDTTAAATDTSYYDLSSLKAGSETTLWEEARATAEEYNAMRNDFICAYAYEMTWSGGPGHTNTFNTYGTVTRNNAALNTKTNYAGMYLYNDLMVNADRGLDENGDPTAHTKYIENAPVVSQFNHPGSAFGTFGDFTGRTEARDSVLNLLEVGNGSGIVAGSGYYPSYEQYDYALAAGWHVAPTNNQDNHNSYWGDSNPHRSVVLTNDFSEAGLYRAMSERRVYATEDSNLSILYALNDHWMGEILSCGDPYLTLTADISDADGEALSGVQIIGENGAVLWETSTSDAEYHLNIRLQNTDEYYYLKVVQADGDTAVTAPVWTGGASFCDTHTWGAGTVVTAATCTANGETLYVCTVCAAERTEITPATGHVDRNNDGVCDTCGDPFVNYYPEADSVAVGDEIILAALYDGTHYAMANALSGSSFPGVATTVTDAGIAAESFWTVSGGSQDGTFRLQNADGKYLRWTSSTTLTLENAAADATDFVITCGSGTASIGICGQERSIMFRLNNGNPAFRAYYNTNTGTGEYSKTLTIYKKPAAPAPEAKIVSAALQLDESINIIYAVSLPENAEDAYMVFQWQGSAYTVTDSYERGGLCYFTFENMLPQCMGDPLTATVYAAYDSEELTDTAAAYSVRQYCVNQLTNRPNDAALKTLLSDLLTYGAAAQQYAGYRTSELVTAGLDLTPSSFTPFAGKAVSFSGTADAGTDWISAGLVLRNTLAVRFCFAAESVTGLTVRCTVNARTQTFTAADFGTENGLYYVDVTGIEATEFDDAVTASFYRNNEQIGRSASYSVNAYLCSAQNAEDTALRALVRALYNYGASAAAYAAES